MNRARIVVLAIALLAGGIAAYLVSNSDSNSLPATPVAQFPTVEVLVAKSDIDLGQACHARWDQKNLHYCKGHCPPELVHQYLSNWLDCK